MIAGVAVLCVLSLAAPPSAAQAPAYRAPRTANGKPELSGIWQALNTADWDLEGQAAAAGPVPSLGAVFARPPGLGVVEGGEIPYLPAMAAKKKENQANWVKLDPEVKCYLPGVPRATYLPYPFQIVQSQNTILISYEYAGAVRIITWGADQGPADSWMGWSNGRWEGETLVVDVTSQNEDTWSTVPGTSTVTHCMWWSATLPAVRTLLTMRPLSRIRNFSRTWKISMPLYRRVEKNVRLLEYKCPEFAEELLYGPLRKKSIN